MMVDTRGPTWVTRPRVENASPPAAPMQRTHHGVTDVPTSTGDESTHRSRPSRSASRDPHPACADASERGLGRAHPSLGARSQSLRLGCAAVRPAHVSAGTRILPRSAPVSCKNQATTSRSAPEWLCEGIEFLGAESRGCARANENSHLTSELRQKIQKEPLAPCEMRDAAEEPGFAHPSFRPAGQNLLGVKRTKSGLDALPCAAQRPMTALS